MPAVPVIEDAPNGEDDRWRIYALRAGGELHHVGSTSLDGIGRAVQLWIEEGEIFEGDAVGVLDGIDRHWLINPWARRR